MLRVEVTLVPNGIEERKRVLSTIRIGNVSGLADVSDYIVWDDTHDAWVYDHRRSDGWGPLVIRAIEALELST